MSGTWICGRAQAAVEEHVAGSARADLLSVLDRVVYAFPAFLYGALSDTELSHDERCRRGAALLIQYAAIQLADDLADGDCTYLEAPTRTGPGTHSMLHHLYLLLLQRSSVAPAHLIEATADLLEVGCGQQEEVRTTAWTFDRSLTAARTLNGAQYRAYFRLLWSGTQLEVDAATIGENYGFGLHVAGDSLHGDARWAQLPSEDKRRLAQHAVAALAPVLTCASPYVRAQANHLTRILALNAEA